MAVLVLYVGNAAVLLPLGDGGSTSFPHFCVDTTRNPIAYTNRNLSTDGEVLLCFFIHSANQEGNRR